MYKTLRWICLLLLLSSLTGCFYWMRAYQVYLQMDDFDQHFSIASTDEFSLFFKEPIFYSEDFISLSKLQPSSKSSNQSGELWRYLFRKVDAQGIVIQPEISFYYDLAFNKENRLYQWTLSPLFLQIAPAKFIEVSLRSLGSASINQETKQLRANTDLIGKFSEQLPKKKQVVAHLGQPLSIKDKSTKEVYKYHFLLETKDIEEGYEDRALSVIKLSFDKENEELIKMKGRFAGLKISVNYKKYIKQKEVAQNQP